MKEYTAVNQAAYEAVRAGMRSQCAKEKCDMIKVLPFETGAKEFDESVNAIDCLNDNSKPDCGRIIMAWNAFKVFQSMKVRSEKPKVKIEVNGEYAVVTVFATYLPVFESSPFSKFEIHRTETGPYGHTIK